MPSPKRLAQQAGGVVLASGIFGILAVLSLLIFYTLLSLQAARDGWGATEGAGYPFGWSNDILTLLAALTTLILVLMIPGMPPKKDKILTRVASMFGIVGSLGIVMIMAAFLLGEISLVQQGAYYAIAFGPLGIWRILVNTSGNLQDVLPKRLTRLGIIVGVGEVGASLSFAAFNGFQILDTADYHSLLTNFPLMIGTALGGFLGYIGGPIWSVLLGRRLLADF